MVTLRRDIAASQSNSIFDVGFNEDLTGYDLFMREKRKYESKAISNCFAQEKTDNLDKFIEKDEVCSGNNELDYQSYEEYMSAQLHRKNPGKLLSKEEFYGKKQTIINAPKLKTSVRAKAKVNAAKKLTKQGKIFVAVYLVLVAVIACIILSVNTQRNDVMANALDSSESVTPMAIEREDNTNKDNIFDKLLDTFTNK